MIMTASQTIRLETELLILGTGAAGCGAALAARQAGIRTLMVDKGKLESSGCLGGGNDHFIAVLNTDEPQDTIDDLVKAYLKPSSGYSEKRRAWSSYGPTRGPTLPASPSSARSRPINTLSARTILIRSASRSPKGNDYDGITDHPA